MHGKTRIVHIITRMDNGGSSENTLLTVSLLNKEKYEVSLVTGPSLESNMSPAERTAVEREIVKAVTVGVKVYTLPSLVRRISPLNDLYALISIYKLLKRLQPRLVHTHTSKAGLLGRWAAYLARVPIIIHTPHGHIFYGYFGRCMTMIFILLEKVAALVTHKIVNLTDKEKEEHLRRRIAPEGKFVTIHSGVALERYYPSSIDRKGVKALRDHLGISEGALIVGTIGRLTAVKGQEYLIHAAKKTLMDYPETIFLLVGDGERRGYLEGLCSESGIREKVLFLGWREDVPLLLSLMDIFVLPSLNEGMGRVLVEAMMSGKPIVASRVCGVMDIIRNNENGILVPPRDSEGLAMAITSLLTNMALREEMGANGRAMASSYSAGSMLQKLEVLYETLLK